MSEEPPSWTTLPPHPEAEPEAPTAERPAAPEVMGMSFEHALAELEKIVQDLERGQLDLEAAIRSASGATGTLKRDPWARCGRCRPARG